MAAIGRSMGCGIALAALAASLSAQAPAPDLASRWYRILAEDGVALGHASHEVTERPDGYEVVDQREISLQEQNHGLVRVSERTVIRRDRSGRTLAITEYEHVGSSWTRTEARIADGVAEVVRHTVSERRQLRVPLPADVRFDNGEGLLAGWDPVARPRLEFDQFNLGAMAVEHVVIAVQPAAADAGAQAGAEDGIVALRSSYDHGQLRGVSRLMLDRQGRIRAVVQPMFGTALKIEASDQATALQPHPPYRVLLNFMVKSPFRIPPGAMQARLRFDFGFRDGIVFRIPETGDQRVVPAEDGRAAATVDVCEGCGPGLPADEAALADALQPTAWMQSDDPKLQAIAAPVARLTVSPARKMEMLAVKARQRLSRVDFTGHFSALEALRRGAGDCTEDAVVLAALGRAAGIPTRVANGMVYTRQRYHGVSNAFMPHSWTLAWVDGRWRSFDMSLDGFDSTHVALTVGDGDARSVLAASQLASLLDWTRMAQVRTGPRVAP